MAKSLAKQAQALVRSRTTTQHKSNDPTNNRNHAQGKYKTLQSIRSSKDTSYALAKIAEALQVQRIKHITHDMAKQYLNQKRDNYTSQKSLDRDRKALSIALQLDIPRLRAISEQTLSTRAYSSGQISKITQAMTERNALAVKIAHNAGLRAHELITIKRIDEGQKTNSRSWAEDRFTGREGERYLVTGKGGLIREVLVSKELSNQLESRRLSAPRTRTDRGVNYLQRYDIGGGNALSASFTRASNRALSFSHGLHGVRHRYAQERIDEIKFRFKVDHQIARDIVAQELGHFRGDITEVYLR